MLGFGQSLMGGAPNVAAASVFAPTTYTGNAATRTITTAIDLTGAASPPYGTGGLVWVKGRSGATGHRLYDTVRGVQKALETSSTAAETTLSTSLTAFGSSGFDLGADTTVNANAATYVAWTFRRAQRFFDVVSWTGNGSYPRTIPHGLGVAPGMIVVKRASAVSNWTVYHRSTGTSGSMLLNAAAALDSGSPGIWGTVDDTAFTLTSSLGYNTGAVTGYTAYLFAHDTASDGIVQCGSYTGSASAVTVTIGFIPRFVLVKRSDSTGEWVCSDTARGIVAATDPYLIANGTNAESAGADWVDPVAGGFVVNTAGLTDANASGGSFVYLAIA